MDSSPFNLLPQDTLHLIFSHLPLRQIIISKSVCKSLYSSLSSPSFSRLLSSSPSSHPLPLIALRSKPSPPLPSLHAFDPSLNKWLNFPLSFLPFSSLQPITSSFGLLFLWADPPQSASNPPLNLHKVPIFIKILVVCNPLTQEFKVLPQLGSAWSRHGSVLVGGGGRGRGCLDVSEVVIVTELALLYYSSGGGGGGGGEIWKKVSSNLPSKPRSPIRIGELVFSLCDVGSPWRSQWKLFMCNVNNLGCGNQWVRVERHEWGDIFDILKRPRLIAGNRDKLFMIGGLKSSYALHSACTTILILRLDLDSMEWDEAGRMPVEMYRFFQESSKFKVFGGGNRVCFSAKRVGRLALWECEEGSGGSWKWIEGVPGNGDGLFRGFAFDAMLSVVP